MGRRWVLALLALGGCGFSPALGTGGAARGLMGHVRAADPVDQSGFDFARQIETRLGRPSAADHDLTYDIATSTEGVGITGDGATTRYNLSGTVTWTLMRQGQRLSGGTESNFTSYSATGSTVAGLTAREDAGRRLMALLADQVVTAMIAAASLRPPA